MSEALADPVPHLGYCPDCAYRGDRSTAEPTGPDRGQVRLTATLVATVVFLTALAPLATDTYVPPFFRLPPT